MRPSDTLLAAVLLLAAGCVSPTEEARAMVGRPSAQLREKYGEPTARQPAEGGELWTYVSRGNVRRHNPERVVFVVREPQPPPTPPRQRVFYEPFAPYIYRDYEDRRVFLVGPDGVVREGSFHREWGYERKGY